MIDRSNSGCDSNEVEGIEELDKAFADYLRLRDSGPVDVSKFLGRYPELRQELERLIQDEEGVLAGVDRLNATVLNQPKTAGFDPTSVVSQPVPNRLGDFTLLRELGRGGMGVVYEARQAGMRRHVAVKILPPQHILDKKRLKRFQNEISAAGQLDHPGIVPVYTANVHEDIHYYAMKCIDGINLAEVVGRVKEPIVDTQSLHSDPTVPIRKPSDSSTGSVSSGARETVSVAALVDNGRSTRHNAKARYFRSVARIIAEAADALHYAHEMGVIHRDIKPANLLLEHNGNVWVTDFGLAQIRNAVEETMSGTLIGTLRYMSPEQAYARRVTIDHRTDVYSLGITLFELLTLEHAFEAESQPTLLHKVAFQEPKRPRAIRSSIPVDLETITLKAISKKPDDRYDSAQEFAADLRRYLDEKPIAAKPTTTVQRAVKWALRNRTTVGFIALLLLLTGAFGTAFGYQEYKQSRKDSELAKTQAAEAKERAETEKTRRAEVEELYKSAESQRLAALSALELPNNPWLATRLAARGNQIRSGSETQAALQAALEQNHELTRIQTDRRLSGLGISPDNSLLLATLWAADEEAKPSPAILFDTKTGEKVRDIVGSGTITSAVFSPKGGRILAVPAPPPQRADDESADKKTMPPQLFLTATGEELFNLDGGSISTLVPENFSPSGRRITLPAGSEAKIYDGIEGTVLHTLQGHRSRIVYAGFSPNGEHVATVDETGTTRIWSGATGAEQHTIATKDSEKIGVGNVSFSPDGRLLLVASDKNGVRIYSVESGKRINPAFTEGTYGAFIGSSAFIAYRYEIAVQSFRSKTLRKIPGYLMATSHDGSLIATTTHDDGRKRIHIIDTRTGETQATLAGHTTRVRTIRFSADGRYIVSVDNKGAIVFWDIQNGAERMELTGPQPDPYFRFAAADDNTVLLSSVRRTHNAVYDLAQKRWTKTREGMQFVGAWSGDDRVVVTGQTATVLRKSEELATFSLPHPVRLAALNHKTQIAFFVGDATGAWLWNYSTHQTRWIATENLSISEGRISPDGTHIALGCGDGVLRLIEIETENVTELKHERPIEDVRYSPDGTLVATCLDNGQLAAWEVKTGERRFQTSTAPSTAKQIQFSPNGQHILSYMPETPTIASFSSQSGDQIATTNDVGSLAVVSLHPREKLAFIASRSGLLEWDYVTGNLNSRSTIPMRNVAVSDDGTQIASATYSDLSNPILYPFEEAESVPSPRMQIAPTPVNEEEQILDGLHGAIVSLEVHGQLVSKSERRYGYQLINATTRAVEAEQYQHMSPVSFAHKAGATVVTAAWDSTTVFHNSETGETISRVVGKSPNVCGDGTATHVAIGATNGSVTVSRIETGNQILQVQHPNSVSCVAFSKNGQQLLSADLDGTLISTDIASGVSTTVQLELAPANLRFAPDGESLLVLPWGKISRRRTQGGKLQLSRRDGDSSNDVTVLDPTRLNAIRKLKHPARPHIARWSPSGKSILTSTSDTVYRWAPNTDTPVPIPCPELVTSVGWISETQIFIQAGDRIAVIDADTNAELISFREDWMGQRPDGLLRKTQPAITLGAKKFLTPFYGKLRQISIDPTASIEDSQISFSEPEKTRFSIKD